MNAELGIALYWLHRSGAVDTLVALNSPEPYWTGPFEDDITELGIRAAAWGVSENDGGNRADLMLADWAAIGCRRFEQP
jgi:hypothetical protein